MAANDDAYTTGYSDSFKEVSKRIRNASANLQAPEEVPEVQKPEEEEPEEVKAIPEPDEANAEPEPGAPVDSEEEPPTPTAKTPEELAGSPEQYLQEDLPEPGLSDREHDPNGVNGLPQHQKPYDPYDPQKDEELERQEAAGNLNNGYAMDCPTNREGFLRRTFKGSKLGAWLGGTAKKVGVSHSTQIRMAHARLGGGMQVRQFEYGGYNVKIFEDPADRAANIYYTFEVDGIMERSDVYPSMVAAIEQAKRFIQRYNLSK